MKRFYLIVMLQGVMFIGFAVSTPLSVYAEANTNQETQTAKKGRSDGVKVKTKGGLKVESEDGKFSFELGGRLHIDAAFYDQDKNSLGDGTELRRARIVLEGNLYTDWGFELGVDFADGDADVKDAYISYAGISPLGIKIGQFKDPFSLEEMTSSNYITFMERALVNVFVPGRNIGIGLNGRGKMWTAAAAVFGESFDDDVDDEGDEGWGAAGRLTFAPIHADTRTLHIGAGASFREPDDEREVRFRSRPESHVTDTRYVNTGQMENTDHLILYGLEAAGVYGPFSLQGEYIYADVQRDKGSEDVDFDGWYIYGSWFPTGESRPYRFKRGSFGRIKPKSKYGALELAVRYSTIDLNDGPISGGEEKNITLGLNWYLNPNVRFMVNYIMVNNDKDANDNDDVLGNDDPNIFQMRFQLDF